MGKVGKVVATAAGALLTLATWLLLVPWDLSEDAGGGRSADDHGGGIATVAVLVLVVAVALLPDPRTRSASAPFARGGFAAWAVLFAWRAGTAETAGANLSLVPLVFVVLPAAVVVPAVLRVVASRLG